MRGGATRSRRDATDSRQRPHAGGARRRSAGAAACPSPRRSCACANWSPSMALPRVATQHARASGLQRAHDARRDRASCRRGAYRFEDFLDNDGITPRPCGFASRSPSTATAPRSISPAPTRRRQGPVNANYAVAAVRRHVRVPLPDRRRRSVHRGYAAADSRDRARRQRGQRARRPPPWPPAMSKPRSASPMRCSARWRKAAPDRIPAASSGTMNNLSFGGCEPRGQPFAYYETIAGGMGASPRARRPQRHAHPHDQQLEHADRGVRAPVSRCAFASYRVRRGSGGAGSIAAATASCARSNSWPPPKSRSSPTAASAAPTDWPAASPASPAQNTLFARQPRNRRSPQKPASTSARATRLRIETPGGGGWGKLQEPRP